MVFRISAVGATTQGAAAPPAGDGRGIYVVKKGQSIYSIAREFGMKPEEFQKWAGLKSTNLSVGQEIKLPTATVPDGKGIFALAKKYNMPIEDFCKINGITKSYQAKKGEKFYVKKDGLDSSKSANATSSNSSSSPSKITPSKPSKPSAQSNISTTNKNKKYSSDSAAAWKLEKDYTRGNKFSFYHAGERRKITVDNAGLQKWGYIETFRGKEYRNKNVVLERPVGNINAAGKIEATAELLKPTSASGPLKGKVIILNPGHGGYQSADGSFDPGTIVLGKKDAKGYYHPIEEWQICEDIANRMATQLRAKGANVIIVQGAAQHGGMWSQNYLEKLVAGNKGSSEIRKLMKNNKNNALFCSIHVNANGEGNGAGVYYSSKNGDSKDTKLATSMQTGIARNLAYLKPIDKEVKGRDLYVCNAMGSIPGVLVEMGNITNDKVKLSLTSENDKQKYATGLVDGILGYYQ